MLKSIRSRLIASYLLVILLAMGIAAILAWSALDRAFLDVLRENLLAQAHRVAQTVEAGDMSEFNAGIQPAPYSQAANVQPGYHTRVIDGEGVVILGPPVTDVPTTSARFQSAPLSTYDELVSNLGISPSDVRGWAAPTADLLSRSEIQSALAGEPTTAVRSYSRTAQRRILYAAYPIRSPGGTSPPPGGDRGGASSQRRLYRQPAAPPDAQPAAGLLWRANPGRSVGGRGAGRAGGPAAGPSTHPPSPTAHRCCVHPGAR